MVGAILFFALIGIGPLNFLELGAVVILRKIVKVVVVVSQFGHEVAAPGR